MDIQTVVATGSYEGKVLGFVPVPQESEPHLLHRLFAQAAHTGCVKAVALYDKWLASGSTDETIRIHDLKKRVEEGGIFHHTGAVNCLEFINKKYLLSAGEDGQLCVWQTKDWELAQSVHAHRSPIVCVAVHPSGKLALTAAADRSFKLWDLVLGKCAFKGKTEKVLDCVRWSPDGGRYGTVAETVVSVYAGDSEPHTPLVRYEHPHRVLALAWLGPDDLCAGGDDKQITFYHVPDAAPRLRTAIGERIKALELTPFEIGAPGPAAAWDGFVLAATSAGSLLLVRPSDGAIVARGSTASRLTCLAVNRAGFVTAAEAEAAAGADLGTAGAAAAAAPDASTDEEGAMAESDSAAGSASASDESDGSSSEASASHGTPAHRAAPLPVPAAAAAAAAAAPASVAGKRKRDDGRGAAPAAPAAGPQAGPKGSAGPAPPAKAKSKAKSTSKSKAKRKHTDQ